MTDRSTKKVLQRGKNLLVEEGWCQFSSAEDKLGAPTLVENEAACTFCATGAVCRAAYELAGKTYEGIYPDLRDGAMQALDAATGSSPQFTPGSAAVNYNDAAGRKKRDVIRLFDKAIDGGNVEAAKPILSGKWEVTEYSPFTNAVYDKVPF